jgi:hypothetical protein
MWYGRHRRLYVDKLSSPVGIVHGEDDMGIFLLFRIPVEQ